jgi:hypothetical protein
MALESYSGNKLVVFLNKTLPNFTPPKRSGAKHRRADAIAMQNHFTLLYQEFEIISASSRSFSFGERTGANRRHYFA